MSNAVRWLIRIGSLSILGGVWWALPYVMPGAPRYLRALQLCMLCAAVMFACCALLATLLPATRRAMTAAQRPKIKLDASAVAEHLRRLETQKAWDRHVTGK